MESLLFPLFMALFLVAACAVGLLLYLPFRALNRRRAERASERLFPDDQRRQENVQGMYGLFGDVGAGMSRVYASRVRCSAGQGQPPDKG